MTEIFKMKNQELKALLDKYEININSKYIKYEKVVYDIFIILSIII